MFSIIRFWGVQMSSYNGTLFLTIQFCRWFSHSIPVEQSFAVLLLQPCAIYAPLSSPLLASPLLLRGIACPTTSAQTPPKLFNALPTEHASAMPQPSPASRPPRPSRSAPIDPPALPSMAGGGSPKGAPRLQGPTARMGENG